MPFWLLGIVSESCKVVPVVLQALSVQPKALQPTLPVGSAWRLRYLKVTRKSRNCLVSWCSCSPPEQMWGTGGTWRGRLGRVLVLALLCLAPRHWHRHAPPSHGSAPRAGRARGDEAVSARGRLQSQRVQNFRSAVISRAMLECNN